jgi:hypothetical protein
LIRGRRGSDRRNEAASEDRIDHGVVAAASSENSSIRLVYKISANTYGGGPTGRGKMTARDNTPFADGPDEHSVDEPTNACR